MKRITAQALRERIVSDDELALLDAREEGTFSESHILYAASLPLSRLELRVDAMVPRRSTPIVVCDAGEGVAERAAARLEALGYGDVALLDGGNAAWAAAGYVLFSGVNVPSKAFGEVVEHEFDTPSFSAEELKAKLDAGEDLVVLDSRPMPEYHAKNIPTGTCCPGVELPYRVHDAAPSPDTTVVVNCAGRTRSIIGAQLLINAGIPNRVVALRNGTMGWTLAGFELENGRTDHAPAPTAAGLEKARQAAAQVAARFGVRSIDGDTFARWQAEADERSLYVIDVRTSQEYEAGHLAGSRWVAGGQLVQETDQHVATLRSRIVLVDDDGVRATMTASWLVQMGWREAVVLDGGLEGLALESGPYPRRVLGLDEIDAQTVDPATLDGWLADGAATLVDLSLNKTYRAGHIAGARYAVRARLAVALGKLEGVTRLVLTSEDGLVALLAAGEVASTLGAPVAVLDGGNAAWTASGRSLTDEDPIHDDLADDAWRKPYEGRSVEDAMRDYLTWEVALVEQVERDATAEWLRHPARTS